MATTTSPKAVSEITVPPGRIRHNEVHWLEVFGVKTTRSLLDVARTTRPDAVTTGGTPLGAPVMMPWPKFWSIETLVK